MSQKSRFQKVNFEKIKEYKDGSWVPARYALAFLAFLGFVNVYTMRVNLSVAMVAMATPDNDDTGNRTSRGHECQGGSNLNHSNSEERLRTGEFDWDSTTQGYVLSAFFYGYIVTQVPGGWLANRFGGKPLFGLGVLSTSLLTLLTPVAARTSVYLLIALRVLEGVGEGVTYPAMHAMWGKWAPMWERSRLVSISYAGGLFGLVVALSLSGILSDSDIMGGWPSVFYIFGMFGCLWFVAWMLLAHSTPSQHPRISEAERDYILASVSEQKATQAPWKAILTSPPVLALCVIYFTFHWGHYMLITSLPIYMDTILNFDLKQNGLLSSLPYLAFWLTMNVAGFLSDVIRSRGYLSTTATRKVFSVCGVMLPCLFLIGSSYVGCNHVTVVAMLTMSVGMSGLSYGGLHSNHLDIAPRFAGVLMGLSNCAATIPGILAPVLIGVLTHNQPTFGQWHKIFLINVAICVVGSAVYLVFGDGEEQDWAKSTAEVKAEGKEVKEADDKRDTIGNGGNEDTDKLECAL